MSDPTIERYGRWLIRHVRDEAIRCLCRSLQGRNADDPHHQSHRPHYHFLLREGIPESALPVVFDLLIRAVDVTVGGIVVEVEQQVGGGHLQVALLDASEPGSPQRWMNDPFDLPTHHFYDEWIADFAMIKTSADLDAIVRGPHRGIEPECPVGTCAACTEGAPASAQSTMQMVLHSRMQFDFRTNPNDLPLRDREAGAFGVLSNRPNPANLLVVPVPPFDRQLSELERSIGHSLSPEEVDIVRPHASAMAMATPVASEPASPKGLSEPINAQSSAPSADTAGYGDTSLVEHEIGSYGDLLRRPNPLGLVVVYTKRIDRLLVGLEQHLGHPPTDAQVELVRHTAIAIAVSREDADQIERAVNRIDHGVGSMRLGLFQPQAAAGGPSAG